MSAQLPLPKRVFAHGWWTAEGEKMSKSLGNVIDPLKLVGEFGVDAVRYFLMREISFGNDGDFYVDNLKNRLNTDLANAWGNLVQRVFAFIAKNLDGVIPSSLSRDDAILNQSRNLIEILREDIDTQKTHHYLEHVFELVHLANQYIDTQKPWSLRKEDPARMNEVLYVLLTLIRDIAIYLSPVLTRSSKQVLHMLGIKDPHFKMIQEPLRVDFTINTPEPLFQKFQ
jgi:methionyl-tRNA synthetase